MLRCYFLLIAFLLVGCGPGVTDGSISISNGYRFDDAGNNEKAIIYFGDEREASIVIDARIDKYILEGNLIFVSRRPRELYKEAGVLKARISKNCEFWSINVKDHELLGPFGSVSELTIVESSIPLWLENDCK